MSTAIKIPREQTEFVTNEGIMSFISAFPGQAQPSQRPGSYAYKLELATDIYQGDKIISAVSVVAQTFDPAAWQRHVFGPTGRLRKLEEMTGRDQSKYPYAQGKYVLGFSQVHTPASLGMKDANLADPAQRAKFDVALAAKAPGVVRYANPNVPADLVLIEQENQKRMFQGLKPYGEADYHKVLLPMAPHEVWSGCYGRVAGRAYWTTNKKPDTVLLALNYILFTRPGERIVGESSPDSVFGEFAPSAALAPGGMPFAPPPPPPAAPGNPWAGLI